jgi:hypothetical protein
VNQHYRGVNLFLLLRGESAPTADLFGSLLEIDCARKAVGF